MKHILRAEAVNLSNFVYDTNKIQPMRGGGYLLLEAVQKLEGEAFASARLEKISSGASIGLFRFNSDEPQKVSAAVLAQLNKATGCHATFVVDHIPEREGKFEEDLHLLTAKNRWKQYQQPTLVLPATAGNGECAYDGLRPGVVETILPDDNEQKKALLSDSVNFRKESGGKLRKSIYRKILGEDDKAITATFTEDLHELAECEGKGNLNNKIAFIYLDGNKFTRVRTDHCKDAKKLAAFSKAVEKPRKAFLEELLSLTDKDFFTEKGQMRLETLLWGGDELEIIVPAWKGLHVVEMLYRHLATSEFVGNKLTYSGGVIFCNNKAPILQLRRLAHELADDVKKNLGNGPQKNALRMLVMESFDTLGSRVGDFAASYYGKEIWDALLMESKDVAALKEAIKVMKNNDFPRNKMFDIARAVKKEKVPNEPFNAACKGSSEQETVRGALEKFLRIQPQPQNSNQQEPVYAQETLSGFRRWFLLNELWDYAEGGEN